MRLETGVVQCDDDWPGIFIRGDNAFGYAIALAQASEILKDSDPIYAAQIRGLAELFFSSNVVSERHSKDEIQHITFGQ